VKPSRSELPFASLVTYSSRGDTALIKKSQTLVRQVKENRMVGAETAAAFVARRLKEINPSFVSTFLRSDMALVPVPRSTLQLPNALWPALEIAKELLALGFGSRVIDSLKRRRAVRKAATASPKDRPKAKEHFESLELMNPLDLPANVTLIDDVVTRGAQLLGAAWRVWSSRPDIVVRGFAVVRTMNAETFSAIKEPCIGSITLRDGECYRAP
jgi:predicted amidophosphoribosyltransferase